MAASIRSGSGAAGCGGTAGAALGTGVASAIASANRPRAICASAIKRADGLHHNRCFEGFLENRVAAGAAGFFFVELLEQARGEDDADVAMQGFYVAAQLEAIAAGEKNVGDHQVWVDVVEAQERCFAVGDTDDLEALLAQDPLTHALGMRAVIGQQDDAHS